ncbi:beta-propeller fold lactonase family protein [Skermania sp. ID1734]|uniref:lactonase family protein n=1 Tax=Skermania sp. ID1734 TaxID=2597516 RepID=UPI00117CFB3D|nr:beta-propeller fold lactonase family protein [Skermania sp. ID1734]TSD94083.1 beta-propeller fold lactonase family protein [Skermania sp. ID1734]
MSARNSPATGKIQSIWHELRIWAPRVGLILGIAAGGVVIGPAGAAPVNEQIAPSYLLVGGTGSSNISVLRDSGGMLTSVGPTVPTGTGTLAIAVTPNGCYAYVAHTISGTLQGFHLGGDGTLQPIQGARLAPGRPIVGAVVSPNGKWLFATVGSITNEVQTYAIAPSGALSFVGSVPIPGATSGLSIPTVSPDGRFLFAPSFIGATMDSFAIGSDGRLSPAGPQVPTGDRPALPSVTPNGKFLYITNEGSNDISAYRIDAGGALTPIGRFPTMGTPHGMAITPDGRYMYFPQSTGLGVGGYTILDNGTLAPLPGANMPSPFGHMPGRVVLSPDAQWLYAIDTLATSGTAQIFSYRVMPGGALAPSGLAPVDTGVTFSDGATGVFVRPR